MRIAVLIVIVILTRMIFLRKWRHLLKFLTKTWNKEINGGHKFSEIKFQKMWVLMFVNIADICALLKPSITPALQADTTGTC